MCLSFMTAMELEVALLNLNLQSYLSQFLVAGFYDWGSLSKISEYDYEALGVLRGHRRKLQRAVARSRGWPDSQPLPSIIDHSHFQDTFGQSVSSSLWSMYSCSNTSGSPASDSINPSSPATAFSNDSNDSNVLAQIPSHVPFLRCIRDLAGAGKGMTYDCRGLSKANVDKTQRVIWVMEQICTLWVLR